MFLGHFALALAAKRWAPRASLGLLVLAAQWADLLWPLLVLGGVERLAIEPGATASNALDFEHYPWTHSLLMSIAWGALLGLAYWAWRRRTREAVVLGLLVVSHWVLDLVVHRPDLPLWPGGAEVGLGLWNSLVGTVLLEAAMFLGGVWVYLRGTHAEDRVGKWATLAFLGFLALVFVANTFGPAPTSASAVAGGALSMWLLVPWAWWADKHRPAVA